MSNFPRETHGTSDFDREKLMGFAEILAAKIREQTDGESSFPPTGQNAREKSPSQAPQDPLHICLARQGWAPLNPPRRPGRYPSSASPNTKEKTSSALPTPEPSFFVSDLSQTERDGLQFFILSGALGISSRFSPSRLRKEYRKLVVRFHPDRSFHKGADAATAASRRFQELQDAKQKLTRFFSGV